MTPPISVNSRIGSWPRNASRPRKNEEFGQVEDEPALRDLLHPRADGRGERAEPQHAEIAVSERRQRALQEWDGESRGAAAGLGAVRPLLQRGGQEHLS